MHYICKLMTPVWSCNTRENELDHSRGRPLMPAQDRNHKVSGKVSDEFYLILQTSVGNVPQSSCRASKTTKLFFRIAQI